MRIVLLAILIFQYDIIFSQETEGYSFFKKLSTNEGLSSYNVRKIIQDKYGFIWIITQDGLNKYDGREIVIYNNGSKKQHQLLGNDIWDIVEDTATGLIWVTSSYGGINSIDVLTGTVKHRIVAKTKINELPHEWVKFIRFYNKDLWIGTFDGIAVYNTSKNSFESFEPIPFKKSSIDPVFNINQLFTDEFGNIWVFIANYGLVIYSGISKKVIQYFDLAQLDFKTYFAYRRFNSVVSNRPGEIILATIEGLKKVKYDNNGLKTIDEFAVLPGMSGLAIKSCNIDKNNSLWFGTYNDLYRYNLNSQQLVKIRDINRSTSGNWLNSIFSIFFDAQNNIWLSTQKGAALARNLMPPFESFYRSYDDKIKIDHAYYVYPENKSTAYVCAEDGFYKVNLTTNEISIIKESKSFTFMSLHNDGTKIVSAEDRLFFLDAGDILKNIEIKFPELRPVSTEGLNSIVYIGDSLALLGVEPMNGFYVWNFKQKSINHINTSSNPGLQSNIVNVLYKDSKDQVWVLSDNSLDIYNPYNSTIKKLQLINKLTGRPFNLLFDICEANNYYWIAVYGFGILQLDKSYQIVNIISSNNGINNLGVYKVLPYQDSILFVTTNNGLSKINILDYSVKNYFEKDGLHSNSFEDHCGIISDNLLYAGGENGFSIINPNNFTRNSTPPSVFFSKIITENGNIIHDTTNLELQTFRIHSNIIQTKVFFSSPVFSNPDKIEFLYKIKELNNDWVRLGSQNFVTLIGIKPGSYTLQVKALNEDNVESNLLAELTLIFLPKWHQTWWFKVLILLSVAAIVYGLYRMRINQLKKEEKIRNQVAGDLHDELGSTLNSIKVYTNLAQMEKENHSHLEKLKEATQLAISGVKDIIWVLDDKRDTIDHLLSRIKAFANPLCEAARVSFQPSVGDNLTDHKLGKEEKRNLYMIIKESINNSIKYADCNTIRFDVKSNSGKLEITIADDGKGFEKNKTSGGYGLKNIEYRSGEIGYDLQINTSPGNGTSIILRKK